MNDEQLKAIDLAVLHVRTARRTQKAACDAHVQAKDALSVAKDSLERAEAKYAAACEAAIDINTPF